MEYNELKKKYNLPSKADIEKSFDFEIKESEYLSRDILKKIEERFDHFCEKIQGLLHSDGNLESMYECEFLQELDKEKLFAVYKEFMSVRRAIQEQLLDDNIEKECVLIKSSLKTYGSHAKVLKDTFKKLSEKWAEKDNPKTESMKYFG